MVSHVNQMRQKSDIPVLSTASRAAFTELLKRVVLLVRSTLLVFLHLFCLLLCQFLLLLPLRDLSYENIGRYDSKLCLFYALLFA